VRPGHLGRPVDAIDGITDDVLACGGRHDWTPDTSCRIRTIVRSASSTLNARRRASRNADRVQIRCLIVDDNQPFLDAARLLLERKGVPVVGVATTSAEALRLEEQLRPDVVLVDIQLGDESGFDLARRLSGTVVLISTHAQSEYAEEIAASRAAGFIPKAQLSASAVLRLSGGPTD
jgi:CheY-like chemotaxis protein